jgi:hypothetical protein
MKSTKKYISPKQLGKKSAKNLLERLGSKDNVSEYFRQLRLKRKDLQKTLPVHQ